MVVDCFFELLRVSVGTQNGVSLTPSDTDWTELFNLSVKQALGGLLFVGLEKTLGSESTSKPSILIPWIGLRQRIINQNTLQNQRAKELYELLRHGGYRSCVLKGQGTAIYYDMPELRQSGDIDIWVEGRRENIIGYVRSLGLKVDGVDIKDSTVHFFEDVMVEVHFWPNCMYNPWTNHTLQAFFQKMADKQFEAWDEGMGFAHTTLDFDLVYSLVHIYRHIFSEGIGLRQLVDYFYILRRSNVLERERAYGTIQSLGMKSFAGGIMYILREKFGMSQEWSLCKVNVRHGVFLLNEIMIGGNFGQYDTRYRIASKEKKFERGFSMLKRNLHFVMLYPSEVLWSPVWKLWHYCWRKWKGYL